MHKYSLLSHCGNMNAKLCCVHWVFHNAMIYKGRFSGGVHN